jgi:ribosomal protein S18 acetylase RimI-like enzyme
MIRPAKEMDICVILGIARACGAAMRASGIFQWNESYPSEAAFRKDLARGELWVFDPGTGPVACLVVSDHMDREYLEVRWSTPDEGARYIHRLAVHPDFQRRGLAGKLMAFAEGLAQAQGATSVRLDTFSRNEGNQRFYEKRGYQRLGAVYFPDQSAYPFYCYERPLPSPE